MRSLKEITMSYKHSLQNKNICFARTSSWDKVLLKHKGKLVTILLIAQLISVQAFTIVTSDNVVDEQSNTTLRIARATSPSSCAVSKDQLNMFRNQINTDLKKFDQGQNSDNLKDETTDHSDNCEAFVNLLKSGVDTVKKRFLSVVTDEDQRNNLKEATQSLVVKYENVIQSVKDTLSQEHQQKAQTLLVGLKLLSELATDLENKQKEQQTVTRNPCSVEAQDGSDCCVNLIDYENSVLIDFVQRAYNNFGKQNNIDSILQFAFGLPWLSQRAVVYKLLFEEMRKRGDLGSPEIVVLANKVEETIDKYENSSCESLIGVKAAHETKNALLALKNNITFYSNKVIESWTDGVSNSNYESLEKLEKILIFMDNINNLKDRATGTTSLFEAMKSNNHLDNYHTLKLAYGVKTSMEMEVNNADSQGAKDKLEKIKNSLPLSIRSLIWGDKNCRINNRKHKESLYAAVNDFNLDKDRRKVFTWAPSDADDADWKFTWKFVSTDNGSSFRIKNPKFNDEYLYASLDKKDADRRWVLTWIPKEAVDEEYWKKWRLVPIDNGRYFHLIHMQFGEYLYADVEMAHGHDNERRGVFLWSHTPKNFIKDNWEAHWEITC